MAEKHKAVAVVTLDADDGKTILVCVCIDPLEAYASKDQKHLCFIREAKLVMPEKDPQLISEREQEILIRAFFGLKGMLVNLSKETPWKQLFITS